VTISDKLRSLSGDWKYQRKEDRQRKELTLRKIGKEMRLDASDDRVVQAYREKQHDR